MRSWFNCLNFSVHFFPIKNMKCYFLCLLIAQSKADKHLASDKLASSSYGWLGAQEMMKLEKGSSEKMLRTRDDCFEKKLEVG